MNKPQPTLTLLAVFLFIASLATAQQIKPASSSYVPVDGTKFIMECIARANR